MRRPEILHGAEHAPCSALVVERGARLAVRRFHGISASSRAMPQKPVTPAKTRPAPTKADSDVEAGRDQSAEQRRRQHQAAGHDLHLPAIVDRLPAIDRDRQAGLFPGIEAAFENVGLDSRPAAAASRGAFACVRAPDGSGRSAPRRPAAPDVSRSRREAA